MKNIFILVCILLGSQLFANEVSVGGKRYQSNGGAVYTKVLNQWTLMPNTQDVLRLIAYSGSLFAYRTDGRLYRYVSGSNWKLEGANIIQIDVITDSMIALTDSNTLYYYVGGKSNFLIFDVAQFSVLENNYNGSIVSFSQSNSCEGSVMLTLSNRQKHCL